MTIHQVAYIASIGVNALFALYVGTEAHNRSRFQKGLMKAVEAKEPWTMTKEGLEAMRNQTAQYHSRKNSDLTMIVLVLGYIVFCLTQY